MTTVNALLLTDLVDSTATTQRIGAVAAARLWGLHDQLARSLLQTWRGLEIDKSDGFLLVFHDPQDAAHYALAYQQALASLPEPVLARVGLHVAAITLRRNGADDIERGAKHWEVDDWLAKAVAARVMTLAPGGRCLVSADAATALAGSGLRLQGHGHWRLQGVAEPIALFEIAPTETTLTPLPDAAKAYRVVERDGLWLPRRELRHSLPAERDAFVGRAAAMQALAAQLSAGARLVSLLGIGGIGKTRLALRFGWQWLGDYPGGVWFCDLTAARSLDGIFYAVAQGLELQLDRSDPALQIGRALAGRGACLLILDNFEQVSAHAEATVGQWLQQAAQAKFIVTSRELLGIAGEHSHMLEPLAAADAAALFGQRARSAAHGALAGAAEDLARIAQLVALLDGLPLAIELAAARARVMSPRTLLERMGERFKLLTSSGGRPKRQATLRATLDWSWDLLTPSDRSALAQLSVFEGGFTLVDAEAVVDLRDAAANRWTPDAMQSLLEKSMLRPRGEQRFHLLHSVQEYAAEHLCAPASFPASGPALQAAAQTRHWRHFAALDERTALSDGCAAADDLVTACRRATAAGDTAAATGALTGVWTVLQLTGPFQVALDLGQELRRLAALGPAERGTVERIIGSANEWLGHVELARTSFEAAIALGREAADAQGEARALCVMGEHHYKRGRVDAARECLARALDLAIGLNLPALQCIARNAIGTLEMRLGHAEAAQNAYRSALALARALADERREGGLLGNLAILAHEAGAEDEALALYEQALALTLRVHDRRWEGNTRCNLGLLQQDRGQSTAAEEQFRRSLAIARELGHAMLEATVLCNLGILAEARGDLADASLHHAQAVEVAQRLGDRRAEGQFRGYLGACHAKCSRIEEAAQELAAGEAALREVADEASLGLLLCQRAVVEHLGGRSAAAKATLHDVRRQPGATLPGELRRALELAEQAVGPL